MADTPDINIGAITESLTNKTETDLSNITQDGINNISNQLVNKLDINLSNITDAGKTNIVNLLAVSSKEINISTPYTVEKAGMVTFKVYTKNNVATEISVNGVHRFYGNIAGVRDGVFSIYVFPGDVVTGQGVNGITFSLLKIYEE